MFRLAVFIEFKANLGGHNWIIVQPDSEQVDVNQDSPADGGNDFWGGDFGGGNSNMDQPEGSNDDHLGEVSDVHQQQVQVVNKPKVGHAFEAPLSEEEELRIQQIEQEQMDRQRALQHKEEEEYKDKKAKQAAARQELDDWYQQKNTERQARSKQNKEEEWAYLQTREEHKKSKNPWEKIVDNVEINPTKYLGKKDVTRMRQAMLARKGDLKEGRL